MQFAISSLPDPQPKSTEISISRGAQRCLRRLGWYAEHYAKVHPSQQKLAAGLKVCDRQLRTYLGELKKKSLIEIKQGGDGRAAMYKLTPLGRSFLGMTAGLRAELTSGLNFRAEISTAPDEVERYQSDEEENFQAEKAQLKICSDRSIREYRSQSECTIVKATETSAYQQSQTDALRRHLRAAGFEHLMDSIRREANALGESLFVIASRIERAWRNASRKESTKPRGDGWIWKVSGLRGDQSAKRLAPCPPATAALELTDQKSAEFCTPAWLVAEISALAIAKRM